MNSLVNAWHLANASMNRVNDPSALAKLRAPLSDRLSLWESLLQVTTESASQPEKPKRVLFRYDHVHVVTKVMKKPDGFVRKMNRDRFGETFELPNLMFTVTHEWPMVEPPVHEDPEMYSPGFLGTLGGFYATDVEKQVVFALMVAAETQGRVVQAAQKDVDSAVQNITFGRKNFTLVVNYQALPALNLDERTLTNERLACGVELLLTNAIDQHTMLLLEHRPSQTGTVHVYSQPQLCIGSRPGFIQFSAVGECGVYVWGDARVHRINVCR